MAVHPHQLFLLMASTLPMVVEVDQVHQHGHNVPLVSSIQPPPFHPHPGIFLLSMEHVLLVMLEPQQHRALLVLPWVLMDLIIIYTQQLQLDMLMMVESH